MQPPIRLLALDLDGTLLDSAAQIPPANRAAVERARGRGVEVVLTTGRRHSFALPIAAALGFDLWLISSNGAITKSSRGELFHRDLLPAGVARRMLENLADLRRHAVLTFDTESCGALALESAETLHGSISRWVQANAEFIQEVVPLTDALTADPVQAMFCGSISLMQAAEQRLSGSDFAAQITVLKTRYDSRDLCILDVLNRGCSKGHALARWAAFRGVGRSEIVAIGDNYNDVEMLEFAGVPYIMGNACEELKGNGWRATRSNDEAGVAAALEEVGI